MPRTHRFLFLFSFFPLSFLLLFSACNFFLLSEAWDIFFSWTGPFGWLTQISSVFPSHSFFFKFSSPLFLSHSLLPSLSSYLFLFLLLSLSLSSKLNNLPRFVYISGVPIRNHFSIRLRRDEIPLLSSLNFFFFCWSLAISRTVHKALKSLCWQHFSVKIIYLDD